MWRSVTWELMMIEIIELSIVNASDVNNTDRLVCQILIARVTPLNRNAMQMGEQAASQKVVFVGSARMRHDELDRHEFE
jgi:hypothetical protein